MNRHVKRQHGAILVMTVIFLVILLGFAALALDLGRIYVLRTEMQNAADAAALAAAAELDGRDDAIADAVLAATTLLSHQGRFADSPELLKNLTYDPDSPADSAFVFYSWIGAELDADTPALYDCESPEDANKCRTRDPAVAHYVKVKLYPELIEDDAYQISLYFLPVLGLFLEDGTVTTASTRVTAVAGAGSAICNYPPMFMCSADPTDEDGGMTVGHQYRIKLQSDSWVPGNFGFLAPPENRDIVDPRNGHTLSGNQALAASLADETLRGCTPSTVSTQPGNRVSWTRDGLNTRFGIYNAALFMDGGSPHANYAAAPNVVDYPRDHVFTDDRYGEGWNVSSIDQNPPAGLDQHYIPSRYNPLEYYQAYHDTAATELHAELPAEPSRYNFYQWELTGEVTPLTNEDHADWLTEQGIDCGDFGVNCPGFLLDRDEMYSEHPDQPPIAVNAALPYLRLANSCDANDADSQDPKNKDCSLLDGEPLTQASDAEDRIAPLKRVLYVALINCDEGMPLHGSTSFDVLERGEFIKMFLTEHIQPPAGGPDEKVDVYTEYLGRVSDKERQKLIHTVIQLYE
jgi:hypothetical protein